MENAADSYGLRHFNCQIGSHAMSLMLELDALKHYYEAISRTPTPRALIHLPRYLNIGDSLIAAGQFRLAEQHGIAVDSVWGVSVPVSVLRHINRHAGTVILQGGGNFGDLWPHIHRERIRVLGECPAATVIQLPQSIHYSNEAAKRADAEVLATHENFRLAVRDTYSLAIANSMEIEAELVPDSAIALGNLRRSSAPRSCPLFMMRKDHEATGDHWLKQLGSVGADPAVWADWGRRADLPKWASRRLLAWDLVQSGLERCRDGRLEFGGGLLGASRFMLRRVKIAVDCLSPASVVVTDRLHVHLACRLLGIPHFVLPNSYGKTARYAETWERDSDGVWFVDSLVEAVSRISSQNLG